MLTRAVLVFVTERKNNVDPRPRAQKKVNYVQLFFAKLLVYIWCVKYFWMTFLQTKVNKGQERSGKLSTLLKDLRRIGTKFNLSLCS